MKTLTVWSLAAGMVCSLLTANLNAATWKGAPGASGTNFNLAANWADALPGAGAALVFGANAADSGTLYNDLTGASFGAITFNAGAPAYIISGSAFTWNAASTLTNNSGILQTIAADIIAANGNGTYNVSGNGSVAFGKFEQAAAANNALVIKNNIVSGTISIASVNLPRNTASSGQLVLTVGAANQTFIVGDINTGNNSNGYAFNVGNDAAAAYTLILTGSNNFGVIGSNAKGNLAAGGKIILDYDAGDYQKFSFGNNLDWGGSDIYLKGGTVQEVVANGLNIAATRGKSVIKIGRIGAGTSSILFGGAGIWSSVNNPGWLLDISDSGLVGSGGSGYGQTNTNGIVSAYITIGANGGAGRDWAAQDTDKLYYAYTGYTALGSANTANALVSGNLTLSAATTANSLKVNNSAAALLDLAGNTLTLTTGGLLYTGASDFTIGGAGAVSGTIYAATTGGLSDIAIWQSGLGTLTVNADLAGATTVAALRIGGSGAVNLNGTFSGTGGTYLDGVRVKLGADNAITRGVLAVQDGATLDLNGHSQLTAGIIGGLAAYATGSIFNSDLANTATLTFRPLAATVQIIDGNGLNNTDLSGNIKLVVSGSANSTQTSWGRAQTFTGGVEFNNTIQQQVTTSTAYFTNLATLARINSLAALGTGTLSFINGGAAYLNASGNFTNPIFVSGTNNIFGQAGNTTFMREIAGAAGSELILGYVNQNNQTLVFNGAFDDFHGNLRFAVHTLGSAAVSNYIARLTNASSNLSNARVELAVTATNATPQAMILEASQSGIYKLGGLATLDYATGSTSLNNGGGQAILRNTVNAPVTFEIGALGGNDVFDGHISNNGTYTAATNTYADTTTNNPVSVTKVGAGTLTLTNVNTYTGTTTVSGGVLLVNGGGALTRTERVSVIDSGTFDYVSTSALDKAVTVSDGGVLLNRAATNLSGAVTLGADGILAGNGTANLNLTAAAGAHLAPGFGTGDIDTLTISGGLTLGNFVYDFDLASAASHDLLNFNNLTLNGSAYTLNVNPLAGFDDSIGFDNVIILSGLASDYTSLWSTTDNRFTLTVSNGNLLLNYTAQQIPEPSTWLLLSLGGATLLLTLRRRK